MKQMVRLLLLTILVLIIAEGAHAQWRCVYATWDSDVNGTGDNTPSVGVIRENVFVALVTEPGVCSFILPYVNADSGLGRLYSYGYHPSDDGIFQVWTDGGFDQAPMIDAHHLVATRDSLIYVASNDPDHNVLVFKFIHDTITVVPPYPRQITGTNGIFGIDVDNNGYVYVCNDTTTGKTDDIKIYAPIAQWTPGTHTDAPVKTIDLPDGIYKGIAVSRDGKQIFVSDYGNRKVIKYVGSPTTGYAAATGFNFTMTPGDTASATTVLPGPLSLELLTPNNILFIACDSYGPGSTFYTYSYGRIYLVNPNTGAKISADSAQFCIDQAKWNLNIMGSFTARGDGTAYGNASGYTSTIDVKFDEAGNVYSQSNNGWTVEKWKYTGTLPTITSVEQVGEIVPNTYQLLQNFPNPFNPSTTIEFSLQKSGFVTLKVYNVLGQEVMTLVNGQKDAGTYRATFDARNMTSGTYFYTLTAGSFTQTNKMLLVK